MAPGKQPPAKAGNGASLYGNFLASLHARAQNDSANAAAYMSRVLAYDPQNPAILNAVFLLKVQEGAFEEAIPLAGQVLQADPGNQIAGLVLVGDAFRRKDYSRAKQHLVNTDERGLGGLLGPLMLGWAESGLGNTDKALSDLAPLSQRKAFEVFYVYHAALINALASREQSASELFAQTLRNPGGGSLRVAQVYGQFLEARGRHRDAADVYSGILERAPQHPSMMLALARAQASRGAPVLVNDAADGAAEALYGIGSVLSQEDGAAQLPLIYLRLATYMKPDFFEAQALLAGLLESMQRWDEAIAIYSKLPKSSPLYENTQIQMALVEDRAGRSDAAISSLRKLLEENPGNLDAMTALADLLRSRELYAEAAVAYSKSIRNIGELQAHHWVLLYARGMCLERTGNWQDAERDLQHALKLEPDQPLVLNYLAYGWIEHGVRLKEARAMVQNAALQRPNDGAIIDSLGWALYRMGDYSGAVGALENAITLRPQDPVINDHLGDAYWRAGRKLEARFQWRRALLFKPEPALVREIEKKLETGSDQEAPKQKLVNTDLGKI